MLYVSTTYRILGVCLLILSIPGKALRTLVELRACQAIQHVFLKPSMVNLIHVSKDTNLVFRLSVYKLVHSSN